MARKTDVVTLADGRRVPIQQLSWLQLRSSRQLRAIADQARHGQLLEALGGADEFAKAYRALHKDAPPSTPDAPAEVVAVPAAPVAAPVVVTAHDLDDHDLLTVLVCGIPSWTKAQIENDLDEPDPEILGRAILALSPAPRTEEQEKNGASPSTAA